MATMMEGSTVTVGHHPELTVEGAAEVFRSHLAGKYDVVFPPKLPSGSKLEFDIAVNKSGWTGVGIKLRQGETTTSFVLTGFTPSGGLQFLAVMMSVSIVLLPILFFVLMPRRNALVQEIRSFIESAGEFN